MLPKTAVFYILHDIFKTKPSFENPRGIFFQRVPCCKKYVDIWKATSSGRAEIENLNHASGDVFNFNSATRVRFSTLTSLFQPMDKKYTKNTP